LGDISLSIGDAGNRHRSTAFLRKTGNRKDARSMTASQLPDRDLKAILDRKVRLKLRIFFLIAVVMLVVLVIRAVQGHVGFEWVALSLAIGAVIGIVVARSGTLSWDADGGRVVSEMDLIGGIVLVAYLVFVFTKDRIVGHWLHNQQVAAAFGVGLTAGAMIARVVVTLRGIKNVLVAAGVTREQGAS
jgi:hypothetical protein